MSNFIEMAKREVIRLEKELKMIDEFLRQAPEGCLKWQNKNGRTYYIQQLENLESDNQESEWVRKYIRKQDVDLAEALAQKHYYLTIRPLLVFNINNLHQLIEDYQEDEIKNKYESLSIERKSLVTPIDVSIKDKIWQWQNENYEKNPAFPENLRYETEQGELVRSKSEVIIANLLYQNREKIVYKYERPLEIIEKGMKKIIYPDFTILNLRTGKMKYWEHAGLLDRPQYVDDFTRKMNNYIENDILPGRDLIVTYETQGNGLDISIVKKLMKTL